MTAATFVHVGITCKDAIATEQFYTRHFGFKRARVVPLDNSQIVFLKLGDTYLELFQATEESPLPPPSNDGSQYPGWRHIAFQVDNVDAKLAEMGNDAQIKLGPLSFDNFIPGWRAAWISDPDGNIIEINQGYVDQISPPSLEIPSSMDEAIPVS